MIYLLLIAIALDVATTLCVLRIGGRELNPIMRALFDTAERAIARFRAVLAPATTMTVTHGALIVFFWVTRARLPVFLQFLLACVWWALVVWNLAQIWRQRRNWR